MAKNLNMGEKKRGEIFANMNDLLDIIMDYWTYSDVVKPAYLCQLHCLFIS